jgi:hypothetical protein
MFHRVDCSFSLSVLVTQTQAENVSTRVTLALISLFLASCEQISQPPTAKTPAIPRPAAVEAQHARPSKKPRVIAVVADTGFRERIVARGPSLTARAKAGGDGITFAGTARKACKISIAPPPPEDQDLSQLISWCGQHDAEMRHHIPPITTASDSTRVAEENRNISVDGWIHFAKKEADNDYHVLLGTSGNLNQAQMMNVEISGLPPHGSRAFGALKQARDNFENLFELALPQMRGSGFAQVTPTHVRITGSMFYDIDHGAGAVGPTGHRPKSAWEIHPVTNISVE